MLALLSVFLKCLPLASIGGRTLGVRISFGDPVRLFDICLLCSYENHIYNIHIFFSLNLPQILKNRTHGFLNPPQKEHFCPVNSNPLDWKEERKCIPAFYSSLAKAINHFLFGDKYITSYIFSDLNKKTEQPKAISLVMKL